MRSKLGQSDRAWYHLPSVETEGIRHVHEVDLLQAVQHYRHALAALEGDGFEHLSATIARKLQHHLQTALATIEHELRRRGLVYVHADEEPAMDA